MLGRVLRLARERGALAVLGRPPCLLVLDDLLTKGAAVGLDPTIMGLGPVYATRKALEKIGLSLKDMDIIELNEAFAAQVLAVFEEMPEFKENEDRINPNGGAIALGHPISATGGIIMTKLLYEMKRENLKYGLATMCIGGGQGIAVVVERE